MGQFFAFAAVYTVLGDNHVA
ncbi:membrane protein YoeI [Kosakonia arachidis]